MPGKANVTNLAGFLRGHDGFVCSARSKILIRICHANVFMELNEVDMVRLKAPQRLINLLSSRCTRASVVFSHDKGSAAVTISKRLAHANLTAAIMVIPGVIKERNPPIERRPNNANAFIFIGHPDMVAAEAYCGDALSGRSEIAIHYSIACFSI